MKIAVAGTGYVGLSIATLLAQHNEVVAVDVIPEKVEKINNRISPIQDEYIEKYATEEQKDPVIFDIENLKKCKVDLVTEDLVTIENDNTVKHDVTKLGLAIFSYMLRNK